MQPALSNLNILPSFLKSFSGGKKTFHIQLKLLIFPSPYSTLLPPSFLKLITILNLVFPMHILTRLHYMFISVNMYYMFSTLFKRYFEQASLCTYARISLGAELLARLISASFTFLFSDHSPKKLY